MAISHNCTGELLPEPHGGRAVQSEPVLVRGAATLPVSCISSESLLAGATEVHIQHGGSLYRLKQTALGKLILTK